MMRALSVVLVVLVGAMGLARADTAPATAAAAPAIDAALAAKLKRGGWTDATIAHRSPKLTVVSARKGRAHHLLIASAAGALVDGGVAPAAATLTEGRVELTELIELDLTTRTPRAHDGYDTATAIWLIRADGTIACKLPGASSTSTGRGCGSGGWTRVSLRGSTGPTTTTIDVTTEHSGTYSEPDGAGGCRNRSPVRSGPLRSRYSIGQKGTCKQVAAPESAGAEGPDL